ELDDTESVFDAEELLASETSLDISEPENLDLQQLEQELEFVDINVNSSLADDVELREPTVLVDDLFDTETESPAINTAEIFGNNLLEMADSDNDTYLELDDTESVFDAEELLASETSLDISEPENLDLQQLEPELEFVDINVNSSLADDVELREPTVLVDDLFDTETEPLAINTAELFGNNLAESAVGYWDDSEDELNLESGEEILGETADLSDVLLNTDTDQISPEEQLAQRENANFVLHEEEETTVDFAAEATPKDDTNTCIQDEFAELEALLEDESAAISSHPTSMEEEDFADLEALLNTNNLDDEEVRLSNDQPSYAPQFELTTNQSASFTIKSSDVDDDFSDLEKLLAEADQTISHSSSNKLKPQTSKISRSSDRRTARFEETMKVPVKQLDDMSNLVGELVVNRNTLEQDHERLRQSLDNLLIQVQHLSDVGARMQELYERSLLEASLLASRKTKLPPETNLNTHDSHTKMGFSELEMDRFTPFHTLSQEMIEFIVRVRESASDIDFVTEETERVGRQFRQVTTQLQEGLTRARMVPFSQTIDRLRRGVRDNAIKYGKQVDLVIEGGDTLIDKMILDHLTDPLTHMLNNAIAHGIETPEIRQKAGKPPVGYITIRAFYQGNQTVISVGDDGAGIDPEQIKTKAIQLRMITPAQAKSISRLEVYDLLFQSGFSIKDKADEISGRGVGMDVVRSEISEIRGIVNTNSTIGQGTTFTIRLPLTLSICKALCCVSDKARIAFPMDGVEDTLDIPVNSIQHHADGQSYISWRDTLLPFRPLKEILTFNRQLSRGNVYGGNRDDDMVSVVVVRSGNTLIALQIDLVLSEQEIVIKQFESPAPKPIGVAGATILGDGRIMPIADVLEIIEIFQGRISKHNGSKLWQQPEEPNVPETTVEKFDPTVLIVDDSITVRELLSLTFIKAGYRVEQARDGQEAWDKLRSGLPCDIVFCDIEMPRCDGLELLSRIQKDSSLNHLPIAMLTSRGADKHRQMAIQFGASGYFTKPYLEEALLEAAVRMLKGEKLVTA
ncbi:hybrid sensor histidine kinase/response regulator, partial [Nodularia sphaerocarpa]